MQEFEIHKSRDIADLTKEVKKWLDRILPKSLEYVRFFLSHKGSILDEAKSLRESGIDRDTKAYVTLQLKIPEQTVVQSAKPTLTSYPLKPKDGYETKPLFEELL